MSKPTKEEILRMIDTELSIYRDFGNCREGEVYQAIHSLIEKFFEWQERAELVIKAEVYGGSETGEEFYDLVREIRDFEKEEK